MSHLFERKLCKLELFSVSQKGLIAISLEILNRLSFKIVSSERIRLATITKTNVKIDI